MRNSNTALSSRGGGIWNGGNDDRLTLSGTSTVIGNRTESGNGGETADYPLLTQEDADAFLKPPQDFEGWEIQLSDDNTQVLLAPVNYRIQYENLMGAVNPNPVSYTITSPTITLLPPHPIEGYRFLGWFDAITGGNRIASIPQGSSGNIILYGRWEEITESYTIAFCGCPCPPLKATVPDGYEPSAATHPEFADTIENNNR